MKKMLNGREIEVLGEGEYSEFVAVALYAIEHGFKVTFVGVGDLLLERIPDRVDTAR